MDQENEDYEERAHVGRMALIRDAQRYRWLRDNNGVRNHHGVEIFIDGEAHAPGHLDSQIDEAMNGANTRS